MKAVCQYGDAFFGVLMIRRPLFFRVPKKDHHLENWPYGVWNILRSSMQSYLLTLTEHMPLQPETLETPSPKP